jgi:hypothetical protein
MEFFFSRPEVPALKGHLWHKLFADYNIFEGRLWSLILFWIFLGPYVFFKIRQ